MEDEFNSQSASLSERLFFIVENVANLHRKLLKQAVQLVREIIEFCNSQPFSQQWFTLAEITQRNGIALTLVIGCLREDNKTWFFNLPQMLAKAALKNPEELEWVNEILRQKALELIPTFDNRT